MPPKAKAKAKAKATKEELEKYTCNMAAGFRNLMKYRVSDACKKAGVVEPTWHMRLGIRTVMASIL